ncbi:MAG: zinc-binding dehydrogenase [Chloroflexota bacterium]
MLGLGLIGQFACQAASISGATVFGLDQVPLRLERARDLACQGVIDSSEPAFWHEVEASGPFDVVIDTAGANALVDGMFAPERLAYRGKVVLVGGRFRVEYTFVSAQRREAALLHTGHHTNEETTEIIGLHSAGRWRIAPLITHRFPIDEALSAWTIIQAGAGNWIGIVLDWD